MNIEDIDLPEIPSIAQGNVLPDGVVIQQLKEAKLEEERKELYRHNWRVAIVSILGGGIMGFISSLIFWLIDKTP